MSKYQLELKHHEKLVHLWSMFAIKIGIGIVSLLALWQTFMGNISYR